MDREARAAKKAAAKRAAASGWYRNLHGTMSFVGLAGLNVAVEGQQDGDADSAGVRLAKKTAFLAFTPTQTLF